MTVCCDELIGEKKVKHFIIKIKGKTEVTKEAQNDEKLQTQKNTSFFIELTLHTHKIGVQQNY